MTFVRRSRLSRANAHIPLATGIIFLLAVSSGLSFYFVMHFDKGWLTPKMVSLETRLPKRPSIAKGTAKAANLSSPKLPSQASPRATLVATAIPPPQSSPSVTVKNSTARPAVNVLPGRIDPVCVSSHIDRLGASDVDKQTSLMQAAGVNWVRFDVAWAAIEQTKGVYNWTNYDYDVNAVTSRGMKVIALVTQYGIPSWERIDSSNWLSTPNNMQDFQAFAYAFSQHYKGMISLYEIGNEPNGSQYWPTGSDPQAYTQFLAAGYRGVKAADRANKVISAGLANISAGAFLQGMYAAGAKDYFDYVGFHPYSYPQGPDYTSGLTSFSQAATLQQIMRSNGDNVKQIMATEVGWPSTTTSWGGVNEDAQASFISRLFRKIEYENYPYVSVACIYDFIDDGTNASDNEENFGVVRADYTKKPSFTTLIQTRQDYNANFSVINP
jgi:hypothetical protein